METILKYAEQQSTWKGLIGLSSAIGVTVSPDLSTQIIALAMALIGIINVIRNEKKDKVK
jgi:hypothetical protein